MPLVLFFFAFPLVSFSWFDHHWPLLWHAVILGMGLFFLLAARGLASDDIFSYSYYLRTNRPVRGISSLGRVGLWSGTFISLLTGLSGGGAVGEAIGREIANRMHQNESENYLSQSLSSLEQFSKDTVGRFGNTAVLLFAVIGWIFYLDPRADDYFWLGVTKAAWVVILLLMMTLLTVAFLALDAVLLIASTVKYFVTTTGQLEWVFPITKGAWSYIWQEVILKWFYYHVSGWAIALGIFALAIFVIALNENER